MLSVTKKFDFSYGHFLSNYDGDCSEQHGHNSEVEVEFGNILKSAPPPSYPGMIIDFKDIKKIVGPIIDSLDHKNLNDLTAFTFMSPTAENITKHLVGTIQKTSIGPALIRVRVSETPDSFAEWRK